MFCQKCGSENKDGSAFCNSCGANLQSAPIVTPAKPSAKHGVLYWIGVLIVLAFVLLFGTAFLIGFFSPVNSPTTSTTLSTISTRALTKAPPALEITKKEFESEDNPLYAMLDLYIKNNGYTTKSGRVIVKVYDTSDTVLISTEYGYFSHIDPGETGIVQVMIDTDVPAIQNAGGEFRYKIDDIESY